MSDSPYTSRCRVEKVEGVHRRAHIAAGESFDMGVHGDIKALFGIEAADRPLPVDFIVASAGG